MRKPFIGMFVVLSDDNKLRYHTQQMYGDRYPGNNPRDILDVCRIANSEVDINYLFVDMFAVMNMGGEMIWEEKEKDTEVLPAYQAPVDPTPAPTNTQTI